MTGLKRACSKTKKLDYDKYCIQLLYNKDQCRIFTRELRIDEEGFDYYYCYDIVNLGYAYEPMTMKEIKERVYKAMSWKNL